MRRLDKWRLALLTAGLAALWISVAQAAPIGTLKQFRVPTANSSPFHVTVGSDGNVWFTEGFVNPPQGQNHNVGRITPAGAITEFLVCLSCFPNGIVQGPNNILYFTKSDPALGRITTAGQVLPDVVVPNSLANGNGIAARGDDIWFAAFNTNSIWRFNTLSGAFTEFHANQIGRLVPATGTITETPVTGSPRGIAIAVDGSVWFTERFNDNVGRLNPATNQVTLFPLAAGAGPEGIAAAPDGSVWFSQSNLGNVARLTAAGVFSEGRGVKGSEPFGITIAPDRNPWYAELSANRIAVLQLR